MKEPHPRSAAGAGPSLRQATVLFADLRGFSAITAAYPSKTVFELLNRCFVRLSEIAAQHQGTIDKFMGDAIMLVFSRDPIAPGDDAKRAVLCAVDMQIAMDQINRSHRNLDLPELYMGIGINTGEVMAGVLGSELYSTRTVIGDEVNLAARIEAFCLRGQILISQSTHEHCAGFVQTGDPIEVYVKGRERGVSLREVHGIASAEKTVPRQERRRSPRVQVRFPFSYQILANDVVSQVRARGTILDIGYGGVLVEVERELGLFEEFKLDLQLPLIGYRATDIYGRVVNADQPEGRHRFGIEFTSLGAETSRMIHTLVHLLIQGTGSEHRFPLMR
jgi:adenylate cyclase